MQLVAQVGLGSAGAGIAAIAAIIAMLTILVTILLPLVYYLPDVARLLIDVARGRDLLAESDQSRWLEGRLFVAPSFQPMSNAGHLPAIHNTTSGQSQSITAANSPNHGLSSPTTRTSRSDWPE